MSVDKFGRFIDDLKHKRGLKGPPGEGFKLTPTGDYDIDNKLLCNVASPVNYDDAVNLRTLKTTVDPCLKLNSKRNTTL